MAADDSELQARALALMIQQARTGDRSSALGLIADFAELAKDPHCFDAVGGVPLALTQYIATCLSDWQKRDFKDAETWFHVDRPASRPKREIVEAHFNALREYRRLRIDDISVPVALASAADVSGLTEGQVRALVQDQSNPGKRDEWLELIATEGLQKSPPEDQQKA